MLFMRLPLQCILYSIDGHALSGVPTAELRVLVKKVTSRKFFLRCCSVCSGGHCGAVMVLAFCYRFLPVLCVLMVVVLVVEAVPQALASPQSVNITSDCRLFF